MKDINALMRQIRDQVNSPHLYAKLLKKSKVWNMLCASMDTIEDTEAAVALYNRLPDFDGFQQGIYLYLYGLFQSMYVQQDASMHLYSSLFGNCIDLKREYPMLYEVREKRDDIFGHPTNRNRGRSYHVIGRPTITKSGFIVVDSFPRGVPILRPINITDCIEKQNENVSLILERILRELKTS